MTLVLYIFVGRVLKRFEFDDVISKAGGHHEGFERKGCRASPGNTEFGSSLVSGTGYSRHRRGFDHGGCGPDSWRGLQPVRFQRGYNCRIDSPCHEGLETFMAADGGASRREDYTYGNRRDLPIQKTS